MSLSIAQKLILAFLGLTVLILIATLGLARWSFERGFQDYVIAVEQFRLEQISKSLSQQYIKADQNWEAIKPHILGRSLLRGLPGHIPLQETRLSPPDHELEFDGPPGGPHGGPLDRPRLGDRPPPPHEVSASAGFMPPPPGGRRPPPKDLPVVALLDNNAQLIAGRELENTEAETIHVPIMVEGKKVGELQSQPRRRFNDPQQTAFSRQQMITSVFIGIGSLALAALISGLLAKLLLAPLQRMIGAVKQLSKGDYSVAMNDDTKDELGQLMEDINHLSKTLKENQSSRQRWLADISHELRTPLTILTGEIETLKDGIRPFNRQQLDSLDQEVQRLRHLTNDLYELSLSDIGGLRYEFTTINLNDSVDRAVKSLQHQAEEQHIDLQVVHSTETIIDADQQRIDQLLTNLISNSLAYTDSPGKVVLSLSATDEHVLLEIKDTPPSVSTEECKKLFEALYRVDTSRNRRTAGAGLGLAISCNIVEAHRGTIHAAPSDLGGLCIHIKFPRV